MGQGLQGLHDAAVVGLMDHAAGGMGDVIRTLEGRPVDIELGEIAHHPGADGDAGKGGARGGIELGEAGQAHLLRRFQDPFDHRRLDGRDAGRHQPHLAQEGGCFRQLLGHWLAAGQNQLEPDRDPQAPAQRGIGLEIGLALRAELEPADELRRGCRQPLRGGQGMGDLGRREVSARRGSLPLGASPKVISTASGDVAAAGAALPVKERIAR